jgi:hypothetical protein
MLKGDKCALSPAVHPWEWHWWYNAPTDDWSFLKPGDAYWIGPIPVHEELDFSREIGHFECAARRLLKAGIPLHMHVAGRYVCMRRLRSQRPLKLGDWKDLKEGEVMLIHPASTPEDVERALTRCAYLAAKKVGRFRSFVKKDGSLWVERKTPARKLP